MIIWLFYKYKFIEFFVFDYDSPPNLLSLFFWITFPLVALGKIINMQNYITPSELLEDNYMLENIKEE